MDTLVIDIDNTITIESDCDYSEKAVNTEIVKKMKEAKRLGYEIILYTSRNMNTYKKDIAKINKNTLPIILDWLDKNHVPYDGIVVGKPWCGKNGFYVDDKAIRPDEFINLSFSDINKLVGNE
jgi:capsule biosynthesis phosphatase